MRKSVVKNAIKTKSSQKKEKTTQEQEIEIQIQILLFHFYTSFYGLYQKKNIWGGRIESEIKGEIHRTKLYGRMPGLHTTIVEGRNLSTPRCIYIYVCV